MDKSVKYLLNDIGICDGDVIVLGISGGPDSMALLDLLLQIRKKVNIKLICAHVDHNVRRVSSKERKFVEDYCLKKDMVFESMIIQKYVDDNFENEARNIRYNFFEEIINKYDAKYLMTAHHGDDLIETVLMRLVRGSTLRGYAGFSSNIDKGNYKIIRPLVFYTKEDLILYNKKHKIPFVIDKTNFNDEHTRNRYRKKVLPFLKTEDKNVHEKFLKFSRLLNEYNDFIDKKVIDILNDVYSNNKLNIEKFLLLDKLIQDKILYSILEDFYQDDLILLNDKHVLLIRDLINSRKKNAYIYLPNSVKTVKVYNELCFERETVSIDNYEIEMCELVCLPNGKHIEKVHNEDSNTNFVCRLSSDNIKLPLRVRTRKLGDVMEVKNMKGHKKVKDIFIDSKIPLNDRDLWPIVVDSMDRIVWLPGLKKSKFDVVKSGKYDIILKYY